MFSAWKSSSLIRMMRLVCNDVVVMAFFSQKEDNQLIIFSIFEKVEI